MRPKTYSELWKAHIDQRIEAGEEFDDEGAHDFNLSDNTTISLE